METTDRFTVLAKVVARRIDEAIVGEEQAVRVAAVRRSRPIVAALADIVETATAAANTRSRIPDSMIWAKLAEEVHAFIGAVVQ